MPLCPTCATSLRTVRYREGLFFFCDNCHGRAVTLPQVRRVTGDKFAAVLQHRISQSANFSEKACPFCAGKMRRFFSDNPCLELDACKPCWAIWFDAQEFEAVPEAAVASPSELQQRVAEVIAQHKLEQMQPQGVGDEEPDADWKNVPAFLGLPVETDTVGLSRQPWLTWSVAVLAALVSVWAWTCVDNWATRLGLIPAEAWRYGGATFLTSFFLHGGVWHLISNLYFLLVFGDNVEDYLGRWRWLLLLVLASVGGDLLHLVVEPRSTLPCVGASGGISGILVFYALEFPRARLSFLLFCFGWYRLYPQAWRWVSVPAWAAFALWLLLQFCLAAQQLAGFGYVSAAAHLGGVAVGFLVWLFWRKLSPRVPPN